MSISINNIRRAGRNLNRDINRAGRDLNRNINRAGRDINRSIIDVGKQAEEAFNSLAGPVKRSIQNEADSLAAKYHQSNPNPDFDDCVLMVSSGVAAAGAKIGTASGPLGSVVGAALGAGGGVAAARIACRRITQ